MFDISYRSSDELADTDWITECLALEGRMYIAAPHVALEQLGTVVVSVCRAFNRSFGARHDAVVEVLLDYDVYRRSALRPDNVRAYVYNAQGEQIYPIDHPAPIMRRRSESKAAPFL